MPNAPIIVWYRNDLRLADNRALTAAAKTGAPVVLLYVLDDETPASWKMGGASRWWLHHSLAALAKDVAKAGNTLVLRRGPACDVLPKVADECKAQAVYFSRGYEPYAVSLEADVKSVLENRGVTCRRFAGALLREPEKGSVPEVQSTTPSA